MAAPDSGAGSAVVPPLYGLVLAGGRGTRLRRDKGELDYHGEPQVRWAFALLEGLCERRFVSIRSDQRGLAAYSGLPVLTDTGASAGPASGLRAALDSLPAAAWLVIATDMPLLDLAVLTRLVRERDPSAWATAYRRRDGTPEPLCAIWEPAVWASLVDSTGGISLRRLLETRPVRWLGLDDETPLDSVNTATEDVLARQRLATGKPRPVM